MSQSQIGVIGLAVMGANLARNLASKGVQTSVYNRTYERTLELMVTWGKDVETKKYSAENMVSFENLNEFVKSLERPRKIILLVKSGNPVDEFIEKLYPLLEDGDIIIDTGNSNWGDTVRRMDTLENGKIYTLEQIQKLGGIDKKIIHFVGCGVSGGEEGALHGPSLMPGGRKIAVDLVLPILEKIAAKDFTGKPCVTNVGHSGAGHLVKMTHNGIEYAIMQGISEIYDILRSQNKPNEEIYSIFKELNNGYLKSFLLDITVDIFKSKDNLGEGYLVDKIQDIAESKGTGGWTVETGLQVGSAVPSIADSVFARSLSSRKWNFEITRAGSQEIKTHSQQLPSNPLDMGINPNKSENGEMLENLKNALFLVYVSAYLQGLDLIHKANKEFNWGIDLMAVMRIWQGGCIIRSKMLEMLPNFFNFPVESTKADYQSFQEILPSQVEVLTQTIANLKVPTPVLDSTKNFFLTILNKKLPTNLIQAQRDLFGAHTYLRNDREGVFSGGWNILD